MDTTLLLSSRPMARSASSASNIRSTTRIVGLLSSNAATGTAAKFGLEAERIGDNISVTFVKEKRECQKSDYGQR